ncbi:hypothetical protein SAMN05444362_102264 [Dysgonomonas macrotermitis]|uniref:Uncharacterized protein n=2 Tax=Dysgonomonas macrotermitis TaxID=1346286 RepID=A0A1M4WMH5_9BACT|nr:hypothetical protein SAMN05444362_102264 [Dysgonomonas macrotermitis]
MLRKQKENNMKYVLQYMLLACIILISNISCRNEQRHFQSHQTDFNELITYFHQIVPKDKKIQIEFENNNHLFLFQVTDIFQVKKNDTIVYSGSRPLYYEWNVNIDNIPDSILLAIHWDKQKFETLKEKLDKTDCISIYNGNPMKIGYKRVFTGMTSILYL